MCIGLPPVANLPATTLWVCSRALFPPPGSLRLIHLQPDFPCPAVAHSCPIAWPASPVFRRVCSPSARRVVYFPRDDCLRACPQAGIPQRRERGCAFCPALRGSSLRALRTQAWPRLVSEPAVAWAQELLSFRGVEPRCEPAPGPSFHWPLPASAACWRPPLPAFGAVPEPGPPGPSVRLPFR